MSITPYSSLSEEALFGMAIQAMRRNDQETAVSCLEEAASRGNATGQIHYLLGAQYAQLGRYDDAAREFELAVTQDLGLSIARFQLGLLLMTAGEAGKAEQTLTPLLQLGQTDPLAHFAAGLMHLARDEFADARHHLARGMALNTENRPLNVDMQKILDRIASIVPPATEEAGNGTAELPHVLLAAYTGKAHG